jgi:hypothetical protein
MTTWTVPDYALSLHLFSVLFNVLLAVLILRLRAQSELNPLTQSQRWGLTLLGYLYLSNTLQILAVSINTIAVSAGDYVTADITARVSEDFNQLASMFLLMIGLTYPRPIAKWSRLRVLLAVIALLWTLVIIVQAGLMDHAPIILFGNSGRLIEPLYYVAVFVPIFLWLPQYERQSSPEMRMVLTLMIWGYLLFMSANQPANLAFSIHYSHMAGDQTIWLVVLVAIVFVYLGRSLYMRLGRWSAAERTNLFFIVTSLVLCLAYYGAKVYCAPDVNIVAGPIMAPLNFCLTSGLWMIVRPTLFFYGLVRYQFFGPSVKADATFALVLSVLAAGGAFVFIIFGMAPYDVTAGAALGAVAAGVIFFLARKPLGQLVTRLLPMSSGAKSVSLSERRTTYAVGLQSAVIAGEVSDPYDAEVLKRLRRDLRVSDREHELLMGGFSREKPPSEEQQVEEVYLFHKGGTLLGYVLRHEKGAHDSKKDMMVTMFTAVREFSADALKRGSDHLGAIDYGSTVLIIELEGDIALGVVLRGRDNPQVRQQMRDLLRKVQSKYSEPIVAIVKGDIKDLGTVRTSFSGLEDMLRGFLKG